MLGERTAFEAKMESFAGLGKAAEADKAGKPDKPAKAHKPAGQEYSQQIFQ